MTVLHAIALAGGFDKAQMEPWQIAEMTRESRAFRRLSISEHEACSSRSR
jgi:hypothetical protein